jgi:hypothetical protein
MPPEVNLAFDFTSHSHFVRLSWPCSSESGFAAGMILDLPTGGRGVI